jgi:hypothetical protein
MKKLYLFVILSLISLNGFALSFVNKDSYVVVAGGNYYVTDVKFTYPFKPTITVGDTTYPLPTEDFDLATCFRPMPVSVSPLDNKILHHVEGVNCQEFSVVKISSAFTETKSLITFKKGLESAYLVVPALHEALLQADDFVDIWGIINDGETTTDIAFFNLDQKLTTSVRIVVYEYSNVVWTENLDLPPGLTFHRLQTPVTVGRLKIVEGRGVSPDTPNTTIVGFVAVGKPGAPEVIPFK